MKQDNKNYWHDRLADYRHPAPDHLLQDVKAEMARRGLKPAQPRKKRAVVPLWARGVAAAVAVLLAVAAIYELSKPTENRQNGMEKQYTSARQPAQPASPVREGATAANILRQEQAVNTDLAMTQELPLRTESEGNLLTATLETPVADLETPVTEEKVTQQKEVTPAGKTPDATTNHSRSRHSGGQIPPEPVFGETQTAKKVSRWSLNPYYSCSTISVNQSGQGLMMASAPLYEESSLSSAMYGSNAYVGSEDVSRKVKNHAPIGVGLQVSYHLNRRLSLCTGLTYEYLSSDITQTDARGVTHGKQKLHYIGIPLKVGFTVWENRWLRTYVSAGGEMQKLVKGRLEEKEEGAEGQTYTQDVKEHRLQWSVEAGAGVELKAGKWVGIYVEPAVDYHFKNGSDVQNYYKEKPTSLQINAGLRININH